MAPARKFIPGIAPLIVFAIALTLRFHHLSQIEHNVDQAYPIWQALNTLETGALPLVGQGTSVLFANPALTGYLYLPFVGLTRSALGAYLLAIGLNSLAVLLAYRAIKGLLGAFPALIAAFLMAVNPWLIEYSRATWVQSLLPFFTCAIAWMLWPVLLGRSQRPGRRLLLALILLALVSQSYLLAYLLLVPVGLLILIFWRRIPKRALVIGAGIIAAASLLYGLGLLTQIDTVQASLDSFGESPTRLSSEAWSHAVRLITGADYPVARGQNAPVNDWPLRQTLTQLAHSLLLLALLLGIGRAVLALRDSGTRDKALIPLLWFGLPVLLMSYVGQPVHPFYQLLGLPAGYALVGWTLQWLASRSTLHTALLLALLAFGLLMAVNSSRFAEETAAAPGVHDLGALPLDYGMGLGRLILDHLPDGGIVYADVDEWTLNSLAGRLFPVQRETPAPAFSIVPRDGGVYVVGHVSSPEHWTPPLMSREHESLRLPGGGLLTLDAYAPDATQQVAPKYTLNIESEDGLTLLGYDRDTESLVTYWRVDTLNDETPIWLFRPFVQVFDADATQTTVIEGEVAAGDLWRLGDVHIHRLTLPADAAALRIGQFDVQAQRNMIFLPDFVPLVDLPEN